MVDVTSLVVSVIAAVGAIIAALITGWLTIFSDYAKRLSESQKIVQKYRDPLILAASDLHCFISLYVRNHHSESKQFDDHATAYRYASFVIGQYLSWANILRIQAQFLCFSTDKRNTKLATILYEIQKAFSETEYKTGHQTGRDDLGVQFMLWRGEQMAIGEIMTVKNGDEYLCMDYITFGKKLDEDEAFSKWFRPIQIGTKAVSDAKGQGYIPDHRLRRLQHLLYDLIQVSDPNKVWPGQSDLNYCDPAAPMCPCLHCIGIRPLDTPQDEV